MKKFLITNCLLLITYCSFAQTGYTCYPTNWWTGMKWNKVQIMIHGDAISNAGKGFSINYPGVKLLKTNKVENTNYVFLDISIAPTAKPGIVKIKVNKEFSSFDIDFELKPKRKGNGKEYAQGVTSKDFMYLIMPDRFSNGDESNDRIEGMRDQTLNRDTVFNRHGGDLQGITNHLDYLEDLGVTTLWLNPVLENDMPNRTEHGYAFTDHYTIDPRLGGAKAYHDLVDATHKRGMKIIQDAVYNHVGLYHFTVQDLPMKNWLNQWDTYTNTSYKDQTLFDPYAVPSQRKIMSDGWFTTQMPDLNENNPYVVNFLIQHALWCVEEFGIDGWRIDTYAYNDLAFMNKCNQALMDEYPKITLFGETWVHGVINQSYFCQNTYNIPYKSNLQATTDFQTFWAIQDAMTRDFGWNDGVNKLYTTLAQDFVYKDPTRQVIFLDNHDISRFFSTIGEDVNKYKSSLAWLLTCRGIPQLYYGDEIAMKGFTSPNDGYVRKDFIGGWKQDSVNKFTIQGRNQLEQTVWQYIATLANYRLTSSALQTGKFMQYLPEDGVYVYFRYDAKQTVMIVMNTSKEEKNISVDKYKERTTGFTQVLDVYTKKKTELKDFKLGSYQAVVLELQK
ncbi:glycoside hydrolase family 13 protein [Ferruginibacter sp. SUN002]|uniref:glycoside hydrolase family 13 protein n=1 Tax=Ferruginibacter sp. SUN002 TaxID=2937789 RepID=UPI003D367387